MSRKKNKKRSGFFALFSNLSDEAVRGIWAVVFFVLGLFFLLAALDIAGIAGTTAYKMLTLLLGIGYYLLPALSFLLSASFFKSLHHHVCSFSAFGSLLFFLSGLGIIAITFNGKGGIVGAFITKPLIALFDVYASLFFLWGALIISLLVLFNAALPAVSLSSIFGFARKKEQSVEETADTEVDGVSEVDATTGAEDDAEGDITPPEGENTPHEHVAEEEMKPARTPISRMFGFGTQKQHAAYTSPPLSLLEKDRGKPGVGDIKASANIIKRTLLNFGITVEIDEISVGPSVTRYALKPAEGVRLSRIIGLQNNLELALAAHPVRIEAPIPGRSLVGIEVPNTSKATVGLASLLASDKFQSSDKPLLVALGKDITGESHFADISKMPHLLIAGATGSGKSVMIHAIITSLLYRNAPEHLRLLLIDPKRVELTLYNNIPHLLSPVITDPKKTILALKWAAKEMERRYDILESEGARDIISYHKNVLHPALEAAKQRPPKESGAADEHDTDEEIPETMPHIVIVIDELADIMQAYPRELESAVVRLAQMSRAVGIHLILSTQRPSVNVITGLIKANIPARIALQVASQIDSRTILDTGGAEKLLGAGDMLYISGDMSKPRRMQTAFISEKEVKNVVKYINDKNRDVGNGVDFSAASEEQSALFDASLDEGENGDDDELYEEAREIIIAAGKGSTSYLQRKLRIGYARAARLMDMLEERGVIGPPDGAKPRGVLEQYQDN